MQVIEQIDKLSWHEFGHFLIALIIEKKVANFQINSINFTFNFKENEWKCFVKSNLEIDLNNSSNENISLEILNILMGAIFEKFYSEKYCVTKDDVINILESGTGKNDFCKLNLLLEVVNNSAYRTSIIKTTEKDSISFLSSNNQFVEGISILISEISKTICKKFDKQNDLEHIIINNDLETLIKKTKKLKSFSEFEENVNSIIDKLSKYY